MNKFDLNLKRISYILNNACNLYCKHCFQNAKYRHSTSLSIEDAMLATKFAIEHNKKESKEIEITLIGGEPSLYHHFEELKKCFKLLFDSEYSISILRIFTNGTIYSKDMMSLLKYISNFGFKDKIHFYITKDFLEDNPTRIDIYGNSQNKIIDENIKKIKSLGYQVHLQYIFTKVDVINYPKILELIYHNKEIRINYGYPCEHKYDLNFEDYNYMIDEFLKFTENIKVEYDFYCRTGMNLLWKAINNHWDISDEEHLRCDPIKGEFSISPKGYIIPCVKLLEKEELYKDFKIKDVVNNPDLLFTNPNILKLINYKDKNEKGYECSKCILKDNCHECRLFPDLINLQQGTHIEHHNHQCERIITFCNCILNKVKEKKLWLEQKY